MYRKAPPHPRFGDITWMPATPRSAGVAAVLFVTTYPGSGDAVTPADGKFADGTTTKFLGGRRNPDLR